MLANDSAISSGNSLTHQGCQLILDPFLLHFSLIFSTFCGFAMLDSFDLAESSANIVSIGHHRLPLIAYQLTSLASVGYPIKFWSPTAKLASANIPIFKSSSIVIGCHRSPNIPGLILVQLQPKGNFSGVLSFYLTEVQARRSWKCKGVVGI
jgi:hypothetical protein